MNRRSYLATAGATVSTVLAGCTEQFTSDADDTDDSADDTDETPVNGSDDAPAEPDDADEQASDPDDGGDDVPADDDDAGDDDGAFAAPEPADAIEAYVAAANAEDETAIAETMHSESPLNPENLEIGFGFEPFDEVDPAELSLVGTDRDATVEDILELEQAALWFEDVDLAEKLGDVELAIATAETGDAEIDGELDTWVLVVEDDHWRVFFVGTDEIAEPDPEEVFEDPIEDAENLVVADVTWDVEPYVDDFETDDPLVEVEYTESPGIEADTVRAETAIAGGNMDMFADEDTDEILWAGSSAAIEFDPEGDQLEVTAITDGDEEVVHREHYRP